MLLQKIDNPTIYLDEVNVSKESDLKVHLPEKNDFQLNLIDQAIY